MRDNAGVGRHTDWKKYQTVIAGGMWLVRNGRSPSSRARRVPRPVAVPARRARGRRADQQK
jgi:hypothetical protein